jgi:hypothetical protein
LQIRQRSETVVEAETTTSTGMERRIHKNGHQISEESEAQQSPW